MSNPQILTDRFLTVMNDELGWGAWADADGDVRFEFLGLPIWLTNSAPADPSYLRLHTGIELATYLNKLDAPSADEASTQSFITALTAKLTRRVKGAKVMLDGEFVVFAVEMPAAATGCLPKAELLTAVLPRMRNMIGAALSDFDEMVREYATLAGIQAATESTHHDSEGPS